MANRIVLELLADANPMLKVLNQTQRTLDTFVASADAAGKSLGSGVNRALDVFTDLAKGGANAAGGLAGGFAAAASAAVLLAASAGRQVEELDQLSQKTGIALNTLQSWSVVMAENNFQAESLTTGMRTLSKQITEAQNPASAAANTFDELGLSIGSLGSTEAVIRAVADKFSAMPDGAEKARLAVQLFGKSGLELIPILNRGSAAFDESRKAAERFGAILSGPQVQALKASDDAIDRLGVAANALKNQLGALFAPAVELGSSVFASMIGGITKMVRETDTALDTLALRFSHVALSVNELASVLFSGKALSGDAWNQAFENIRRVDDEVVKLIARRRELASLTVGGEDQNNHVLERGKAQEELGKRILAQLIDKQRLLVAEQHAQEALGHVTLQIIQRETAARNDAFAMQLQQAEEVNALQFQKTSGSTLFDDHLKAVQALMSLIPELTFQEASLLAVQNAENGQKVIAGSRERLQLIDETVRALSVQADTEQAYADHAAAAYRQLGPLFGDVATTRQYAFDAIDARVAASMADLESQLAHGKLVWDTYYEKVVQLDLQADAQRRGVAAQFPTFFEQQMQQLVQSNTFSLGQISANFTNATAQWMLTGKNFSQFWQSLQVTLLQSFLNTLVQMFANWVLHSTAMEAAATALETVKTTIFGVGEAARLGISKATNAMMATGTVATLGAMVALGNGSIAIMAAVMLAASAMMAAIAGALAAGIVTAEMAPSVAAASGAIAAGAGTLGAAGLAAIQTAAGAALVAGTVASFSEGGIGEFGTGTPAMLHGREAIIPLNRRGAGFMQDVFGGKRSDQSVIHTHVYLDKREIAVALSDEMPSALRRMGVL